MYHPNLPPQYDEPRSWSEPWPQNRLGCDCGGSGFPGLQATCEGLADKGCTDDAVVQNVVGYLKRAQNGTLGNGKQPWFVAAGLHKPHLPFYAPQANFALYKDPAPPVPAHPTKNSPFVAFHPCLGHNPDFYSDWGNFSDIPNVRGSVFAASAWARTWRSHPSLSTAPPGR